MASMTDNSASKQQAAVVAQLMDQGYSQQHAAKVAKTWFPTPAQARMAQVRAAKHTASSAPSATNGYGTPSEDGTSSTVYRTRKGTTRVLTAAGRQGISEDTKRRWALAKELGLRSLGELKAYEQATRPETA